MHEVKQLVRQILLCTSALSVLLAVFTLYTRSDFLVTLANQVWSCY